VSNEEDGDGEEALTGPLELQLELAIVRIALAWNSASAYSRLSHCGSVGQQHIGRVGQRRAGSTKAD
jgi:hypothetical protein